jgi:hypothetical protein
MTTKEVIDQYNADMAVLRAQMADTKIVKDDAFFARYQQQIRQLNAALDEGIRNADKP